MLVQLVGRVVASVEVREGFQQVEVRCADGTLLVVGTAEGKLTAVITVPSVYEQRDNLAAWVEEQRSKDAASGYDRRSRGFQRGSG